MLERLIFEVIDPVKAFVVIFLFGVFLGWIVTATWAYVVLSVKSYKKGLKDMKSQTDGYILFNDP